MHAREYKDPEHADEQREAEARRIHQNVKQDNVHDDRSEITSRKVESISRGNVRFNY
jgi:hypothetical protein